MIKPFIYIIINLCLSFQATAKSQNSLYIYNWANYIPNSIISEFEKKYNTKVVYDVFDSDEMLDAKLLSGHTGYDVVFPTNGPFLNNQIKNGLFKKLDKKKIKNYKNINPQILSLLKSSDPDNAYTIPFMWTPTAIGYNEERLKSIDPDFPRDSLEILFNPKYAEKFSKCGIAWFNFPVEVISLAMLYNGDNPDDMNPEKLKKAQQTLERVRKYVKYILPSDVYSDYLANGTVCLALGWMGELSMSKSKFSISAASQSHNMVNVMPKEGFIISLDAIAIPADSENPHTYKFIDYLLKPKVSTTISDFSHHMHPNINTKDQPNMDKDTMNKAHLMKPQQITYLRKITKIWNNVLSNMD